MRKTVSFILIVLLIFGGGMAGCASVSVDPKTGVISYFRMGDQQIEGLEFRMSKDGKLVVKMDKQGAHGEALIEALRVINTLVGMAK